MRSRRSTGTAAAATTSSSPMSSSSSPRSAARRSCATPHTRADDARKPVTRAAAAAAAAPVHFDVATLERELGVDDSYVILGIDEAGRGPVLGPMVYTGALIALGEHDRLLHECRVADSKTLDAAARATALSRLRQLPSFRTFTVVLSARTIASAMYGGRDSSSNLNTLSHDTAMRIVRAATLASAGKLCAAFVDTVGPPESYARRLCGRFPHLRITVAARADSAYAIVSAASIVAKVTRDAQVRRLLSPSPSRRLTSPPLQQQKRMDDDNNNDGSDDGEDAIIDSHTATTTDSNNSNNDGDTDTNEGDNGLGSGYPSDPKTVAWLRRHVHRFFVYSCDYEFVRQSWGPVVALANNARVCVPVVFAHELDDATRKRARAVGAADDSGNNNSGGGVDLRTRMQRKMQQASSASLLSSARAAPRRHAVYTHLLRLQPVASLDDV